MRKPPDVYFSVALRKKLKNIFFGCPVLFHLFTASTVSSLFLYPTVLVSSKLSNLLPIFQVMKNLSSWMIKSQSNHYFPSWSLSICRMFVIRICIQVYFEKKESFRDQTYGTEQWTTNDADDDRNRKGIHDDWQRFWENEKRLTLKRVAKRSMPKRVRDNRSY